MKYALLAALSILLIHTSVTPAQAAPTQALEQQVNIHNQEYSTSGTSQPTDNSLGLIQWQANAYNDETVYFEAIIRCDSCSGGSNQATATLYSDTGASVSSASVSTSNSSYTLVRSTAITNNLTNGEEYTVRLSHDASSGTAYILASRLVITQSGSSITDTLTSIEMGNNDSTTNTSYELLTSPPIFLWDADVRTDINNVYFEATLNGSDGTATSYAALSSAADCSSTVSDSEVSATGTTWSRDRSTNIASNLSDDTEFWVCLKTTSADTGSIANAKLIIEQSNPNGIDQIEYVHQYINTLTSDTDSTYTAQNYLNTFDSTNITADIIRYYFETTLSTTAGTGFARLFNSTDGSAITGSEISTTSTGFDRQRSQDLSLNLPSSSKTLDTQLRNGTTNNTQATTSWLVIQLDDVLDPDISFSVSGTAASSVFNGITTSVATTYNELDFGNLTFGIPRYAAHQLDVTSNASGGYAVTAKLNTYLQGLYPGNNIDSFPVVWSSPTAWTEPTGTTENDNTGWFGANTTDTRVTGWGSAIELFAGINNSPHTVMQASDADDGTTIYVTYAMEVNILQPADLYAATIVYDILPTY